MLQCSGSHGRVSMIEVFDLLFDDENESKLHAHGIRPEQVVQVLDNGPWIGLNRKERRASHIMIGVDDGGSCITVPLEPTYDPTLWRPVTAYPCKRADAARLAGR